MADTTATSLRSAHLASNTPYKWFNLREDGYYKSIRDDLMHGNRMIGFVVPGGVDVDAMKDLEFLEYYLTKNSSPILEYLKKNYKTLEEIG